MKNGMSLQVLEQELERRNETKRDLVVPTRSLRYVNTLTVSAPPPAGDDTIGAMAWIDRGMAQVSASQNGHSTALATVDAPMQRLVGGLTMDTREGVQHFPLNDLGHEQLATHLGIPRAYYNRLATEFPGLLAENANTLLAAAPEKEHRTVRTLDGVARAFLSDIYETLDNFNLMEVIVPMLKGQTRTFPDGTQIEPLLDPNGNRLDVKVRSCNVSDRFLQVKLTVPTLTRELKVGTTVRMGASLYNSEVGLSKVGCLPFTEVLQCTNGMTITNYGTGITRRHVGGRKLPELGAGSEVQRYLSDAYKKASDRAFFIGLSDVLRGTLSEMVFNQICEPSVAAMGRRIEGTRHAAVEVLARRMDLGEVEAEGILHYWIDATGDDKETQWGLANAVTRYSQDVESYDRATELERIGGNVITLAPGEWHEVATAKDKPRRGTRQ